MLHYWVPSDSVPDAHSHRWSFRGEILVGKLLVERFVRCSPEVAEAQLMHEHRHRLDVEDFRTRAQISYVGAAALRQVESRLAGAGVEHAGQASEIHRVRCAPGAKAVSLFTHPRPVRAESRFFATERKPDGEASSKALSLGEVGDLTELILVRLSECHDVPTVQKALVADRV